MCRRKNWSALRGIFGRCRIRLCRRGFEDVCGGVNGCFTGYPFEVEVFGHSIHFFFPLVFYENGKMGLVAAMDSINYYPPPLNAVQLSLSVSFCVMGCVWCCRWMCGGFCNLMLSGVLMPFCVGADEVVVSLAESTQPASQLIGMLAIE